MSKEQVKAYLKSGNVLSDLSKKATEAGYEVSENDLKEIFGGVYYFEKVPEGEKDSLGMLFKKKDGQINKAIFKSFEGKSVDFYNDEHGQGIPWKDGKSNSIFGP